MIQKGISSYITGLTNLASYYSEEIGPSYIEADCFDLKNYKDDFSKYHNVSPNDFKLVDTNKELKDVLLSWLGSKDIKIIDGIIHWINVYIGSPKKIYSIKCSDDFLDSLSIFNGGSSRFYFIEDIYFVEFKEYMVCFILGNNE